MEKHYTLHSRLDAWIMLFFFCWCIRWAGLGVLVFQSGIIQIPEENVTLFPPRPPSKKIGLSSEWISVNDKGDLPPVSLEDACHIFGDSKIFI